MITYGNDMVRMTHMRMCECQLRSLLAAASIGEPVSAMLPRSAQTFKIGTSSIVPRCVPHHSAANYRSLERGCHSQCTRYELFRSF